MDTPPLSAVQQAIQREHPDLTPEELHALQPDDYKEWLDKRMGSIGDPVSVPSGIEWTAKQVGGAAKNLGNTALGAAELAASGGNPASVGEAGQNLAQGIAGLPSAVGGHLRDTFLQSTPSDIAGNGVGYLQAKGIAPQLGAPQSEADFQQAAKSTVGDALMATGHVGPAMIGGALQSGDETPIEGALTAGAMTAAPELPGLVRKGARQLNDWRPSVAASKGNYQAAETSASGVGGTAKTIAAAKGVGKSEVVPLAVTSPEMGARATQMLGRSPELRAQTEATQGAIDAGTKGRMQGDLRQANMDAMRGNASSRIEELSKGTADWAAGPEGWPSVYRANPEMQLTPELDQLFNSPHVAELFKRAEKLQMMGPDVSPYAAALKKFNTDVADATTSATAWDKGTKATTSQLQDEAASLQHAWDQRASAVAKEHIAKTKIAQQEWDQQASLIAKQNSEAQAAWKSRIENLQGQMGGVVPVSPESPLFKQAMQNFGIPETAPILDPIKELGPRPETPSSSEAYQVAAERIGKRPEAPTPEQIQRIIDSQHGTRPIIPDIPPNPSAEMIHRTRMAVDDVIRAGSREGAKGAQKALAGEMIPIREAIDAYLRDNAKNFSHVNDTFSERKDLEGAIQTQSGTAAIEHQPTLGADQIWKETDPARIKELVNRISTKDVEGVGLSPRDEMMNALRSHLQDEIRSGKIKASDLTRKALADNPRLQALLEAAQPKLIDRNTLINRAELEALREANLKIPKALPPGELFSESAPWYMKSLAFKIPYKMTVGAYRGAVAKTAIPELFSPGMPKWKPGAPIAPAPQAAKALAAMLTAKRDSSHAP